MPGITDKTSGVDAWPTLQAQLGYGPQGTAPDSASWTWVDASGDDSWDATAASAPGIDQYVGKHTAPATPSIWLRAFRFSGDSGKTWLYCDMNGGPGSDGSEDGFQEEYAALLTVRPADPCTPNPCTTAPSDACDGIVASRAQCRAAGQ